MTGAWTDSTPLRGGDIVDADFESWLSGFRARNSWIPEELARHYARSLGTDAERLIQGAECPEDLGRCFGGYLYECEVRWLIEQEWARTGEDVLVRRTKHGLFLSEAERADLADWMDMKAAA